MVLALRRLSKLAHKYVGLGSHYVPMAPMWYNQSG